MSEREEVAWEEVEVEEDVEVDPESAWAELERRSKAGVYSISGVDVSTVRRVAKSHFEANPCGQPC